ncbi:hypothetical protein [Enterococcus sp.]
MNLIKKLSVKHQEKQETKALKEQQKSAVNELKKLQEMQQKLLQF